MVARRPLPAPRRRRRLVLALGPPLTAVVLSACGSSNQASTVAAVTRTGLQYTVRATVRGGQACTTQTYAGIGPRRKPFTQTTRFCGPSAQAVPPLLIQVSRPRATLILDRPASCAAVRLARARRPLTLANTRCSATTPRLRLTLLPAGRMLTIAGIPGVAQLDLAGFSCTFICTRQLTPAVVVPVGRGGARPPAKRGLG